MGKGGTGAKAGIVAAIPAAILDASVAYVTFDVVKPYVTEMLKKQFSMQGIPVDEERIRGLVEMSRVFGPLGAAVFDAVFFLILGTVLAYLLLGRNWGWGLRAVVAAVVAVAVTEALGLIGGAVPGGYELDIPESLVSFLKQVAMLQKVDSGMLFGITYGYLVTRWYKEE